MLCSLCILIQSHVNLQSGSMTEEASIWPEGRYVKLLLHSTPPPPHPCLCLPMPPPLKNPIITKMTGNTEVRETNCLEKNANISRRRLADWEKKRRCYKCSWNPSVTDICKCSAKQKDRLNIPPTGNIIYWIIFQLFQVCQTSGHILALKVFGVQDNK